MRFPLPSFIRRHMANRRLLMACTNWSDDVLQASMALEDGADPNFQMLHASWREPTGVSFNRENLFGTARTEIIFGGSEQKNYWRTPLGSALEMFCPEPTVDLLLAAGANPWAPGNGDHAQPGFRLCPISRILGSPELHRKLAPILEKHLVHIAACYHDPAVSDTIARLRAVHAPDREIWSFIDRIKAFSASRDLQRDTPAAQPSAPSSPRARF